MFSLKPPKRTLLSLPFPHRKLHNNLPLPKLPPPTPFVPDAATFLTLIGRALPKHASKLPDWTTLFSLTSSQLRDLGIEPARTRRYLLRWRERFRSGEVGIGGDLAHVKDGVALARVVERHLGDQRLPQTYPECVAHRTVVNVPVELKEVGPLTLARAQGLVRVKGLRVKGRSGVMGSYVSQAKGAAVELRVTEGMWEQKRGRKLDGGERRRAEVRSKRAAEQRKAARA
ncbi:MAG: hypothetical protein M1829_005430 [Trizodia sp. TS-e1964]|nr:MAG: hypothetical protein M1829_005430 [Trizodia sp. TS-e1964]